MSSFKKNIKKIIKNHENYNELNLGSQNKLRKIKDEINFFINSFEPKIYPDNAVLDRLTYKTRINKLSIIWAKKWLEIYQTYPSMLINNLLPQIKKCINAVGFDRELIIDTIETEALSMFEEFVYNNINDIKMYQLMGEMENKVELIGSYKVERNIDYYPFQFNLVSGFVYSIFFKKDEPDVGAFSQTKILKVRDLNSITDEDVKKEIKDKLKEVIHN